MINATITLSNKLTAMLVHEKGVDRAGAAFNVNIGHFYDPKDTPGLAHLLFMGSAKYPKENEYSDSTVDIQMPLQQEITPITTLKLPRITSNRHWIDLLNSSFHPFSIPPPWNVNYKQSIQNMKRTF